MKNTRLFLFISSFEGTSYKKMQLPVFYFLLFSISFYINRHYFYNFLDFHSTLLEKNFRHEFFLF